MSIKVQAAAAQSVNYAAVHLNKQKIVEDILDSGTCIFRCLADIQSIYQGYGYPSENHR